MARNANTPLPCTGDFLTSYAAALLAVCFDGDGLAERFMGRRSVGWTRSIIDRIAAFLPHAFILQRRPLSR
jgi:hypothetical protein